MIKLDYRTNNPRWGLSGIKFNSWESYSFTLGFLSNIAHFDSIVSLHIEGNNEQGAWDKEGRIHYYGSLNSLRNDLFDLYNCSSAGNGRITRRINSNGYIISLINHYGFEVRTYVGYTTADVFPPEPNIVENNLKRYLMNLRLPNTLINDCLDNFTDGYNL